jgi:hypothetical protein
MDASPLLSIKSSFSCNGVSEEKDQQAFANYQRILALLAEASAQPGVEVAFDIKMRVSSATSEHPPLPASPPPELADACCDICCQVLRTEEGDSSIVECLCSRCTLVYYDALKDFSEDIAFATLHSQDAIRLFVLRLRVGLALHDDEDSKELLNERAAEVLERLPASFAPWWRDTWNWSKDDEMKAARKAVGWTLAALNAPILQRLAAMFAAEQDKVKEMEARHQRELEEAWEAGALEGVQDMEEVMKEKLEELEAEHKKQMAAVTEASAEASNAVGEAAEKIRHDARRRGYADGYAFANQKATAALEAMRSELEAARKEGENHQAGYIRLIGERDEAVLEVVDLRQELDASAEANEKLEAQVEALEAAAAANYQAGYSAAEEKFRAEFQELRKCRADATEVFQAMRSDLERLSAENQALRQKAEEDKQMVQRHLKEVAKGHAEATAWEKEEIERLRKDVRAHEARVAWHADMAKRDMEANLAKIQGLEAQVADHSRWRDEANHAASVAQLEAKKLRANLAEADWDKEQLLKAVQALRELVGPTQKLMTSNPELFGGEPLPAVKTEPMPPAIIRMREPVSEEDKERLVGALKKLVPRYCGVVEESPPTALPGIVAAEQGLCEVWTVEEAAAPVPVAEAVPVPVAEAVPVPVAEAVPVPVAEAVPVAKQKPNYNHPNWPSPITKRFAKHLATHSSRPGPEPKTIKTHQDALEFIAKRANISVEQLLKWSINHYQSFSEPWTLVKGSSHHFHMGTAPATWWC